MFAAPNCSSAAALYDLTKGSAWQLDRLWCSCRYLSNFAPINASIPARSSRAVGGTHAACQPGWHPIRSILDAGGAQSRGVPLRNCITWLADTRALLVISRTARYLM
jgi:hypothetical protein